eukprot:gene2506-3252_t
MNRAGTLLTLVACAPSPVRPDCTSAGPACSAAANSAASSRGCTEISAYLDCLVPESCDANDPVATTWTDACLMADASSCSESRCGGGGTSPPPTNGTPPLSSAAADDLPPLSEDLCNISKIDRPICPGACPSLPDEPSLAPLQYVEVDDEAACYYVSYSPKAEPRAPCSPPAAAHSLLCVGCLSASPRAPASFLPPTRVAIPRPSYRHPYLALHRPQTWDAARQLCEDNDLVISSAPSEDIQNGLFAPVGFVARRDKIRGIHLGARQKLETNWTWQDGSTWGYMYPEACPVATCLPTSRLATSIPLPLRCDPAASDSWDGSTGKQCIYMGAADFTWKNSDCDVSVRPFVCGPIAVSTLGDVNELFGVLAVVVIGLMLLVVIILTIYWYRRQGKDPKAAETEKSPLADEQDMDDDRRLRHDTTTEND